MPLKAYALHSINMLGATQLLFPQLTERTINPRTNIIYNRGSGSPSPSFAAVVTVAPEITWSTNDVRRTFDAVSVTSGLKFKAGSTYTGVDAFFQMKEDLGLRGGALTGIKATGTKGIIIPTTLEANVEQEARLSMSMLWLTEDGITIPITWTNLVTCPASFASEKFTFGGVVANGATVPGVDGITIDFGITIEAKTGGGHPYPQFATIGELAPKITCRTPNIDVNATYSSSGVNLTGGAKFFLRKMQSGTTPYADADIQHIAFNITAGQGIMYPGTSSANGTADAQQELIFAALEGAGGPILSYTAPVAIVLP